MFGNTMAKVLPCEDKNPQESRTTSLIMSLIEEKSLKVIVFSGKQEDWKFWKVQFLARARGKGFREILLGTVQIPKDSEKFDLNKADEKAKLKFAIKMNLHSKNWSY